MRRANLVFDDPRHLPKHQGWYYCFDTASGEDSEGIGVSLREAWDAAQHFSTTIIQFWPTSGEDVRFKASVGTPLNSNQVQVSLSLSVESLLGDPLSMNAQRRQVNKVRRRLRMWLAAVIAIHELCGPCAATLFWERWGHQYTVGVISGGNSRNELLDAVTQTARLVGLTKNVGIAETSLMYNSMLQIMEPIPVPWEGRWTAIRLGRMK